MKSLTHIKKHDRITNNRILCFGFHNSPEGGSCVGDPSFFLITRNLGVLRLSTATKPRLRNPTKPKRLGRNPTKLPEKTSTTLLNRLADTGFSTHLRPDFMVKRRRIHWTIRHIEKNEF